MKKSNKAGWYWLTTSLILAGVSVLCKLIGLDVIAIVVFVGVVISLIITVSGIIIVPNNPPHIAIVTRWGNRKWCIGEHGEEIAVYLGEGVNWIFLRKIYEDVILINMIKKDIDFTEQTLVTPDNGTTKVYCSAAYVPNREYILNYINSGLEKGISHLIVNIKEEKLRIWARKEGEGPQTWEALNAASEEATELVAKAICANPDLSDEEIKNVSTGHKKLTIPHLGIDLTMFNLTQMQSFGKVFEESVKAKAEEQERKGETYEIQTELNKAIAMQEAFKSKGHNMTLEQCYDKVMENKIAREGNNQLSLAAIAKTLFGAKTGGK